MAGILAGGAAMGAIFELAFSELYQTLGNAVVTACTFKGRLKRLKSTLDSCQPLVEQICQLNTVAGHSEEETRSLIQKLKEGNKLVSKCSEVNRWNYFMKAHYGRKLCELDEDMKKFFQVGIQPFIARNGVEAVVVLRDIQTTVNEMSQVIMVGVEDATTQE